MTTILKRHGVGQMYEATLPNGSFLTVWPDCSAEVTRSVPRKIIVGPSPWCPTCSSNVAPCPDHPAREEQWSETRVVASVTRQPSVAAALSKVAPYVDFGVRPDGTFPVRAYMDYGEGTLLAYPHLRGDIPDGDNHA